MYTTRESRKLTRLSALLRPLGWRFWGVCDGAGMLGIVTNKYEYIPNGDAWLNDFLDGTLTSSHIRQALQQNVTPYYIKEAALRRKRSKDGQ
jgi:hypothetical protein